MPLQLIISFLLSFYCYKNLLAPRVGQYSFGSVCFKDKCFKVELAKTSAQRDLGLMGRRELDRDAGMFFIFENEGIYPFWMKNTFIPLDIIWIDNNKKIVYISPNVQPCKSLVCPSLIPSGKAKYVLEINAGICKEINLKVGDEIKVSI